MNLPRDPNEYTMGLMDHLRELRKRLFYSIIAIILGGIAAYCFSSEIFAALCDPYFKAFTGSPLIGTSPAEAWVLKVKVAIFCGILLTSPFLFYQLWSFVAPGLYSKERRLVIPFVTLSTLLFSGGALFCYYEILPLTLSFFYGEFLSIQVAPTIRIGDHLSMAITTIIGFGLVFEMPLLTFFLARAGMIDHTMMIRWYRHAVVCIFVIAAILTPPDALTQLLMAGPLLVLYGVSVGIAFLTARKRSLEVAEPPQQSTSAPIALR